MTRSPLVRPTRSRSRPSVWHRGAGVAVAAIVVSLALVAQTSITSEAAWNDREWDQAAVGTVSCASPNGAFASRGEGRVLSGSLLGINLDTLAAASGVRVTNNGTRAVYAPVGAVPAAPPTTEAWADPLNVTALSAVNVNLGNGILKLPLDTSTGAVGQFGQAQTTGNAAGAGGYVTESGGIGLAPATGYPNLATLSLSQLVNSISPSTAALLGNVSDVSLTVGAVTGRATMNGCTSAWASNAVTGVTREYLASSLRTEISSPTVGGLLTGVTGAVQSLKTTVSGLPTNTGVLNQIKSGTETLVNGVLSAASGLGVRLGSVTIRSLQVNTLNTSALDALLTQPFGDPGGILTVHPTGGTVSIDTAALLATAYPGTYGSGLNALPPNTNLLSDPTVLAALTSALTTALNSWIAHVDTVLNDTINSISVSVGIDVILQLQVCVLVCTYVPLIKIISTTSGTLTALTTSTSLEVLGLGLLTPLLDALVGNVVSALVSGLSGVVKTGVDVAANTFRSLQTAVTNLSTLTSALLNTVSQAYNVIYGPGIVSVMLNVQNDPVSGMPEPPDLASLPTGRYEVSAIRVGVLEAVGGGARLYLGRGAVGPGCSHAEIAAGGCSGY